MIIICITVVIVALIVTLPTLQKQRYEHLEEVQKKNYQLAEKQIDLEKEKVKHGKLKE